ncbi:MAG: hypothetical protein JST00_23835 [Deltaproteobacteria bacterium]|nr:hypothetical protein [Deltaproteobacteria bacterium]
MKRLVGLSALALALLGPRASARAETSYNCPSPETGKEKAARAIFDEGVQIEASDPEAALARYRCASTLAVKPAIELRIGVVAERLHRDEVAIVAFERYLELAGASAPDAESMRSHVRELKAKRDRELAERRRAREKADEPVGPPPPPQEEPHSSTGLYAGWGLAGVGVVLGAIGTGFLLAAKSNSDAVQELPPGTPWASDQARGTFESAQSQETTGTVMLVVAPLAIAAGVALILYNQPGPPTKRAGAF